jgi:hypothetical protein
LYTVDVEKRVPGFFSQFAGGTIITNGKDVLDNYTFSALQVLFAFPVSFSS